jgi:hypothetical protein
LTLSQPLHVIMVASCVAFVMVPNVVDESLIVNAVQGILIWNFSESLDRLILRRSCHFRERRLSRQKEVNNENPTLNTGEVANG